MQDDLTGAVLDQYQLISLLAQSPAASVYRGRQTSIDRLVVVKDLDVSAPKTSELVKKLADLNLDHVLILVKEFDDNLTLSARNLSWVDVLDMREINPVSLVRYDKVLATSDAIKSLEERFA